MTRHAKTSPPGARRPHQYQLRVPPRTLPATWWHRMWALCGDKRRPPNHLVAPAAKLLVDLSRTREARADRTLADPAAVRDGRAVAGGASCR